MEHERKYLTPKQAAEYLCMSVGHLGQLRYMHAGPAYSKPTPKTVLYSIDDLDAWVDSTKQ